MMQEEQDSMENVDQGLGNGISALSAIDKA
jgi:hypothetical protein